MTKRRPALFGSAWRQAFQAVSAVACLIAFGAQAGSASEVLSSSEREQLFQGYFDRMTEPKPLTRFQTREQWLVYREELKGKILKAIGLSPWPERVPLAPVVTGKLERDGYSVERVYYQVMPRVYASGYLYLPRGASAAEEGGGPPPGKLYPAILNPHGHWTLGAMDPTVQSRCIALAKKGYVAFSPDSTHVADLGLGLCPIGLMTWNNMRALDYLESLACVDQGRIGCTGESGGGQQTLYLAALDERVKVIVPAVLVSYFKRILFATEDAHCFCNHAPGIAGLTDEHEMAAMFAPRPALFICATGDWTKEFPQEEFPQIRHIYGLVGGDVDCVRFDKPHNYDQDSRERMYAWMNKYLKGGLDPAQAKEPPVTPEPPEVLKALSGPVPGDLGLEGARAYYRERFMFKAPTLHSKRKWREFQEQTRRALRELLGETGEKVAPDATSRGTAWVAVGGRTQEDLARVSTSPIREPRLQVEKLVLQTEPGITIPAWLFRPETKTRRAPAVVVVHAKGKETLVSERGEWLQALLGRGVMVLAVDPRFRGELRRNWHWNEVIWGRPEEGMAAHDLNCAGAYLRSRPDVNAKQVSIIGMGEAGRFALCAAALDPNWAEVAVDQAGRLYADADVLQCLPNLLRHGDLPQIAALIAPRKLWINGAEERFGFTQGCYRALGKENHLRCSDVGIEAFLNDIIHESK